MHAIRFASKGDQVRLEDLPTKPKGTSRKAAERQFAQLAEELFELQELMFGAATHGVLVVLQGRDTAGKDGTIKHVVGCLNPRGVRVASFGVPTAEERAHDFLWRIRSQLPPKSHFAIFNRSHYEDVLVVRVHDLAPKATWRKRYQQINAFEETLADAGTIVLKFFLHISPEEQEERLLAREQETRKAWKLSVNDWKERPYWHEYTAAYQDAIGRCAREHAPWYVVPADKKWFRNLAVAEAICAALRPYRGGWQATLDELGATRRAELDSYRGRDGGPDADADAHAAAAVARAEQEPPPRREPPVEEPGEDEPPVQPPPRKQPPVEPPPDETPPVKEPPPDEPPPLRARALVQAQSPTQ